MRVNTRYYSHIPCEYILALLAYPMRVIASIYLHYSIYSNYLNYASTRLKYSHRYESMQVFNSQYSHRLNSTHIILEYSTCIALCKASTRKALKQFLYSIMLKQNQGALCMNIHVYLL